MITWDLFMSPMLRLLENGDVLKLRDLQDRAADLVQLTFVEREEMLPSGQLRFRNRAGWAVSYLFKVGAVTRPSRGYYALTDLGRELLSEFPDGFNEVDFKKFVGDRGIALFDSDQSSTRNQVSEEPSPA